MLIIPIRTQSTIHRTPVVNYLLILLNIVVFLMFDESFAGETAAQFKDRYLAFHSDSPAFHQFLTYQFTHADAMHLLGNMLFLWVFGNGVNTKMGDWPYLLFYLAGGLFAAWGYASVHQETFHLVGASGAVAAVTTAYLVLFPRSRVTVLLWFFVLIHFFEVSAIVIIVLKIIVWDNIVGPVLGGAGHVAHKAHLAGYLFGFAAAMGMLLIRALPRDQFDILALWKRWNQRRELAVATAGPAAARARYGPVARMERLDPEQRASEDKRVDQITDFKSRIGDAFERGDTIEAAALYEEMIDLDPAQCLSKRQQLEVGRKFYATERFPQAAIAFERFVECYPYSGEADNVRLLLGIIHARDLRNYELADKYLTNVLETLRDGKRREQCFGWLKDVRAALGKPAPEQQGS